VGKQKSTHRTPLIWRLHAGSVWCNTIGLSELTCITSSLLSSYAVRTSVTIHRHTRHLLARVHFIEAIVSFTFNNHSSPVAVPSRLYEQTICFGTWKVLLIIDEISTT
jgi:hypothetical protein